MPPIAEEFVGYQDLVLSWAVQAHSQGRCRDRDQFHFRDPGCIMHCDHLALEALVTLNTPAEFVFGLPRSQEEDFVRGRELLDHLIVEISHQLVLVSLDAVLRATIPTGMRSFLTVEHLLRREPITDGDIEDCRPMIDPDGNPAWLVSTHHLPPQSGCPAVCRAPAVGAHGHGIAPQQRWI
jgi:hypothetical protein